MSWIMIYEKKHTLQKFACETCETKNESVSKIDFIIGYLYKNIIIYYIILIVNFKQISFSMLKMVSLQNDALLIVITQNVYPF